MVYEYTIPRVPTAAMYTSPGPAYQLPALVGDVRHDPRSVHYKYPSYSFGIRHGNFKDSFSPGPCYYPNPKIYRDGCDGIPHYSIYPRTKGFADPATPGPGAYCPDYADPIVYYSFPSYSLRCRHCYLHTDSIPAANSYTMPNVLGQTVQSGKPSAPCYSIRGYPCENFIVTGSETPGPGNYCTTEPNVYKNKAPVYSLTSRNLMPGDPTQKPGPSAHVADTSYIYRCNPSFSFGIKHSPYTTPLFAEQPEHYCGLCY